MQFVSVLLGAGTLLGTFFRPFLGITLCRDTLPSIPLLGIRLEAPVYLGHHGDVTMAELAGDEFERGASARHPHRPVVAGVVQPVSLKAHGPETLAVDLAGVPPIDAAEHALTRQHGREMRLEEGPGPIRYPERGGRVSKPQCLGLATAGS